LASDGDAEAIAAIYRPVVENTAISIETIAPDRLLARGESSIRARSMEHA
jgi:hypothetical protein